MQDAIVFLDIDGVLNDHTMSIHSESNTILRRCIDHLNLLLFDADAKVVLSSAWRYHVHSGRMNLDGLDWLFRSHGLASGRLIGVTREDTMPRIGGGTPVPIPNERGRQIADWRHDNGHAGPYVVIDDLDLGFTDAGMPFVQTDGAVGLTSVDAAKASALLRLQMGAMAS